MGVEENLRLVDAFFDLINARDWGRFADLLGESVVWSAPDMEEPIRGRAVALERPRAWISAVPDLRLEVTRAFGQGGWVCTEVRVMGTHGGPLRGFGGQIIPPTKKSLRVHECSLFRVEDGKIAEIRVYFDRLALMAQLGLSP